MVCPEIIKCQFKDEIFYVDRTNGDHPVSSERTAPVSQRSLCVDEDDQEVCLFVFVTERCNLSCPFCFERQGVGCQYDSSPRYSIDELVAFIRIINIKKAILWFFGGEPLLNYSWIVSCINRLKDEDIDCSYNIATNLTKLNSYMIEHSRMWGMRYIVNLDASLKMSGGQKYGETVKTNLTLLRENELEALGMSVWSPNCKVSIPSIMETYVPYDLRYFDLNIAHCFRYTGEDIRAFTYELEGFADWYILNILSHDLRFLWIQPFSKYIRSLLFPEEPLHISACGSGKQLVAIATDGNLYPCQTLVGHKECACGSVQSRIWVRRYEKINDNIIPTCSKCDLKYSCKARCLANNIIMEKDVLFPEKSRCVLEHKIFACSAYIVRQLQKYPLELAVLRKAFKVGHGEIKSAH